MVAHPWLSIVIPVHDEVENLDELHHELAEVLKSLEDGAEILLVDDGGRRGAALELGERADDVLQPIMDRRALVGPCRRGASDLERRGRATLFDVLQARRESGKLLLDGAGAHWSRHRLERTPELSDQGVDPGARLLEALAQGSELVLAIR